MQTGYQTPTHTEIDTMSDQYLKILRNISSNWLKNTSVVLGEKKYVLPLQCPVKSQIKEFTGKEPLEVVAQQLTIRILVFYGDINITNYYLYTQVMCNDPVIMLILLLKYLDENYPLSIE